jgi:hypothetical protein
MMNHRLLTALAALVTVMVLLAAPVSAQAPAKALVTPKTADGQPDLQGVWSNATSVPLERPANLGAK